VWRERSKDMTTRHGADERLLRLPWFEVHFVSAIALIPPPVGLISRLSQSYTIRNEDLRKSR
jgi:hypothetical protein